VALRRSLHGLDWLNFFVANVQTGFGPFIAVYLAEHRWTEGEIGVALSIGTIVSLLTQVPAGAVVDSIDDKRRAVWFGILAVSATALLYALSARWIVVYAAELFHGLASSILTPAIAAVTLRLVGRSAFGERVGHNARFASVGSGVAAGLMGIAGSYVSANSVFWLTALLGLPALLALRAIGPERAPPEPGTPDPGGAAQPSWAGLKALFLDRRLLVFAACVVLFFVSNAAMVPIEASSITRRHPELADVLIAVTVVLPQGVVALLSPWAGHAADRWGRRPVMVLGWAMLPVQAVLYAAISSPFVVLPCQLLSGVSAAVFGVLMTLVAADLTRQNGRFNLTMGSLGIAVYVGATISTSLAGWTAERFGDSTAFLLLAGAGLAGTLLLWLAMPETREQPAVPPSQTPALATSLA
jgi:MFS family permease